MEPRTLLPMRRLVALLLVIGSGALPVSAGEFEVYGWWGVGDDYVSPESYREAREAGFTSLMQCAGGSRLKKYLDWAQAAGLKLGVQNAQMLTDPEPVVEMFRDHPAVRLWHLKDEPHLTNFPQLAEIVRRVKAADPDPSHPAYVNLYPIGSGGTEDLRWRGTTDYLEYLERAVGEMKLPFLSFDHYPCRVVPHTEERPYVTPVAPWYVSENWYENLELAAAVAREHGIPLSAFAHCTSHTCIDYDHPVPTLGTLRLEIYSALAYGARSIQYFTYYTPENASPNWFHEGCLERDGRRGLAYDQVRRMNRELHARVDDRLTDATCVFTAHTAPYPQGTRPLSRLPRFVKSLEAEGALVSLLHRPGEDVLMVVNRSPNDFMRLDIAFESGVRRVLDDGAVVDAARYGTTYRLDPGYAEIFLCASETQDKASWYVDAAADVGGDGSAGAPFASIQAAVDRAPDGDVIRIAPGVYGPPPSADALFIDRRVTLEATGGRDETVVSGGIRTAACQATVKGLTIAGGGIRGDRRIKGSVFAVDCVISNCVGTEAVSAATVFRSLIVGNGVVGREAAFYHCVIAANAPQDSALLQDSDVVNCTVFGNAADCLWSRGRVRNSLFFGNAGTAVESGDDSNNVIDETSRPVYSPFTGDLRPIRGSEAATSGDAAAMRIDTAAVSEENLFTDYQGRVVPSEGAVCVGAVQTTAEAPSFGGIELAGSGVFKLYGAPLEVEGLWAYPEAYPAQIHLDRDRVIGKHVFAYWISSDTQANWRAPEMDDSFYVLPPPTVGELLKVGARMSTDEWVRYVDPDPAKGNDSDNTGRTADSPYRTLQKAADSLNGSYVNCVVYCAEGDYGEDQGSTPCNGNDRRLVKENAKFYIRFKGAGKDRSVVSGRADSQTGACGETDTCGGVYLGGSCILQGFTLKDCYGRVGGGDLGYGGAGIVGAANTRIADCRFINCRGDKGVIGYYGGYARCEFLDSVGLTSCFRGVSWFVNCLFDGNCVTGTASGQGQGVIQEGPAYNCTLRARSTDVKSYAGGISLLNSIVTRCKESSAGGNLAGCLVWDTGYFVTESGFTRADPKFVSGTDLRVREDSPALTVGEPIGTAYSYYSTGDILGRPQVFNDAGAPTVGCYQDPRLSRAWYVNAAMPDDSGDGETPATAKRTLRAVMEDCAVFAGDTVHAAKGRYNEGLMATPAGNFTTSNRVVVAADVTLVADEGPSLTTITGQASPDPAADVYGRGPRAARCAYLMSGARLVGFTVTGGRTDHTQTGDNPYSSGGGILCPTATAGDLSARIENCTITGNCAVRGGGSYAGKYVNCRFGNNVGNGAQGEDTRIAWHVGCVFSPSAGNRNVMAPKSLENCTFGADTCAYGGAVAYRGCLFLQGTTKESPSTGSTLEDCAYISGGSIDAAVRSGDVTATDCLVVGSAEEFALDANGVPRKKSPLVDRGPVRATATAFDGFDNRGSPRIYNDRIDIGACEYDGCEAVGKGYLLILR